MNAAGWVLWMTVAATSQVPTVTTPMQLDGRLGDWTSSVRIRPFSPGTSSNFQARIALQGSFLLVGVEVDDGDVTSADRLLVSFEFPSADGVPWDHIFNSEGGRVGGSAPRFSVERVRFATMRTPTGFALETRIPWDAMARFPSVGPMRAAVCVTYIDHDDSGRDEVISSCRQRQPDTGLLSLPESLRAALKIPFPREVDALEARKKGWVGYGRMRYPVWAMSTVGALNASLLRELIYADSQAPVSSLVPVPTLRLPDGTPLIAGVFGDEPHSKEGCRKDLSLEAVWFLSEGVHARQVLVQPLVDCRMGRARSMDIDQIGVMRVTYTEGFQAEYRWKAGKFVKGRVGVP